MDRVEVESDHLRDQQLEQVVHKDAWHCLPVQKVMESQPFGSVLHNTLLRF